MVAGEGEEIHEVARIILVGVMSQSVFSMTRNLLTIRPFFHAAGVMLDFAVNIGAVEEVSERFPWAVGTVALMIVSGAVLGWVVQRRSDQRGRKHGSTGGRRSARRSDSRR